MGLKEKLKKKSTPREIAKKITDNLTPNIHIGNHTYESLSQELISLANTKPMFRDGKWRKRANNIRANLLNKISAGERKFQPMILHLNQIEDMR